MLTFDEIVYAGGGNESNLNYYLNNNATTEYWWLISPWAFYINSDDVLLGNVSIDGSCGNTNVENDEESFRPVVTLLSTTKISGGNGTISNPYTVKLS